MKKKKKAALYNPYLDVLGGGEKHILSMMQVLENQGYELCIFWDQDLSQEIDTRLNLHFQNLHFIPNIFKWSSPIKKLHKLASFDIFFYVTDGSYFFSTAKRNFVFCMVPNKNLYRMNTVNQCKTYGYRFISNSVYTQKWLQEWGIDTTVIYPYVNQTLIETDLSKITKEKIILSVGRFFPHLHSKKHEIMLDAFKIFNKKNPDYMFILAGGLKEEDKPYFNTLKKKTSDMKNVILKANVSFNELQKLYRVSSYFWHFTGYGVNENQNPHIVEHLGMTPLEAMATGTIPFCYNAGGPKEIILDGKNGYLFKDIAELVKKQEHILSHPNIYQQMQQQCQRTAKEEFSFEVFEKRVINVLLK
ncbi:MAG: glycosyltransferase [Patescibacteria group bacterium]